jgi:hypothetical protein
MFDDSRDACILCTLKHIAQAYVLWKETYKGYPQHKWICMGHMAEAEDEIVNAYPEVCEAIRTQRLAYQNYDQPPAFLGLIELVLKYDEDYTNKKLEELGYK